MTVRSTEFETAKLERHHSVANLDDVNKAVQVEAGKNKTVASLHACSPSAHSQVACQTLLQRSSQVLIEDGVQVTVVDHCSPIELERQTRIGGIGSLRVVVSFPKFHRSHIGDSEER